MYSFVSTLRMLISFHFCQKVSLQDGWEGHKGRRRWKIMRKYEWSEKLSLWSSKHRAIKTYRGSGSTAPHILHFGTRCKWVISFTPQSLYPLSKSLPCQSDRKLSLSQRRSGGGGEEKNSRYWPCREYNPCHPARSLVTILNELPRLLLMMQEGKERRWLWWWRHRTKTGRIRRKGKRW
jgi:hypothetical protein